MKNQPILLLPVFAILVALSAGEVKEDVLEFRCSPPMGLSGYIAMLHARIERPKKLYCPEVTIYWPGNVKSGPRQADCPPLAEGEEAESWNLSDLYPHGVRIEVPPGKHTILMEVKTNEMVARRECTVEASN